ncbi:MAG: hypothetical protein AB1486_18105 [Planctomycetota bacterium]
MKARCSSARLLGVGIVAVLLGLTFLSPGMAQDLAKELNAKLQAAKSRLMATQIDEATALFKEASELLARIKAEDPDNKDLAGLQQKLDKLAEDLGKKVVQRAQRDISPMQSALETAMRGGDPQRIKDARTKLAETLEKHRESLQVTGGASGAAMIASAEKALAEADTALGAKPEKKPEPPEPAEKKPTPTAGDPQQINSEIQRKFRAARDLPTPEIVKLAGEIKELIAQLRTADPRHSKLAEYEQKVEKLVADAYAADLAAARSEIDRRISRIDMYLERNREDERPQLKEQRDLLAAALEQHRAALEAAGAEGKALIAQTEAALKKVDEQISVALSGDALTNEWIAKLSVFHVNGEKDLSPGINGAAQYEQIKKWRTEAGEVYAAYEKVSFTEGKTAELERAERFFKESLGNADRNLEHAVASRAEKAQEQVKRISDLFAADQAWKTDKSKQPQRFADELLEEASRSIAELASYATDHPALGSLRAEHSRLMAENRERRRVNKALTLVKTDRYKGKDAAELKKFAESLVPKDHPGAQVLRLTIFTEDWKEETVIEWTDTTRTALRKRTTRTLMFCTAFKDKDGVFRDFGYLNQNLKSDGSWGPTYGHLTKFRSPMLEENVAKNEPEP